MIGGITLGYWRGSRLAEVSSWAALITVGEIDDPLAPYRAVVITVEFKEHDIMMI